MIENEFNILPGGWRNKDEPIILWETLEIHSACKVNQTLNKAYYTKSYHRMPFEVFVEITSKRSIDNLFTKIISLEESIKERVWYVGGLHKAEIEYS